MPARIITVANQKGGVGKTTTAVSLGAELSDRFRVLLIDLDPQANATSSLGLSDPTRERSTYDVLLGNTPLADAIVRTDIDGLDLAPADRVLAGAQIELVDVPNRERRLERAIAPLPTASDAEGIGGYDLILIDTPPSLGLLTINALVASDGVIVPVQCEYLSLRGLVQLENTLSMIRENLNPHVRIIGILPTMFDGRTLHSKEAVEILTENFGPLVFNTRIRKTVRYAEAPVKGSSVLKYDPRGPAADAYRDLAKEVLNGAQARKHA
jgi:chromosome partitioning protein